MQYIQGNIISNVEKTDGVKYFSLPKTIESLLETVRVRINIIPFIFFEADVGSFEIIITAWRKRDQNQ